MSSDPHGLEYVAALRRNKPEAAAWIEEQSNRHGTTLSTRARRVLMRILAYRLCGLAQTAFDAQRRAVPGMTADELVARLGDEVLWSRFLGRYPVLARLIDGSFAAWKRRVARFLAAVARDHAELGAPAPRIEDVESHGELLEARRDTLTVTLAGDQRWVYRDRDLAMASWFMELLARVNAAGLSLPLYVRRVVARDGTSWDEVVAAAPCTDEAQVRRYFVRAGMLVRLVERLGGADFHMRNVIAAGEHPVLIDLETFFHPHATPGTLAELELVRSPLRGGLVGLWITGAPGRRAAFVAGLNPGGIVGVPYTAKRLRRESSGGLEDFYGYLEVRPTIPASLGDHVDDLVAGYLEMDELLARSPELFGMLAAARNLPVRVVGTTGNVYDDALMQSLEPSLLASEAARDAWLATLPLQSFEKAQLRDAMIPRGGERLAAHAALAPEGPPSDDERSRRVDVLTTAIALCDDRPARPRAGVARPPSLAAAAVDIGDALLRVAYPGPAWTGISWRPWSGVRLLGSVGSDLLSGNAGIALVLAYLFKATGLPRFRTAARDALKNVPPMGLEGPSYLGAHCGLGGAIYALARVGALVDDAALAERAATLLDMVPRQSLATGPHDVIFGVSGFILGVLSVGEPPAATIAALRTACDRGLPPSRLLVDGGYPALAPTEEAGIAYTIARLGARWSGAPLRSDGGHLLWRLGVEGAAVREARIRLDAPPRDLREELEVALTAHDVTGDVAFLEAARLRAETLLDTRARTGLWFPGTRVAERHNLSALSGVTALAHAFLRLEAPAEVRSIWRLE